MTTHELTKAERHEKKIRFAALVARVSPIVRRYRDGNHVSAPQTVIIKQPRLACLCCGNPIGRAECKGWKGEQP